MVIMYFADARITCRGEFKARSDRTVDVKAPFLKYCLRAALLTHAATQDIEQHMPDQPRRDHLAVVEESEVVCSQRCRQIGDLPIFEPPRPRE